jgi:hypothetical protein
MGQEYERQSREARSEGSKPEAGPSGSVPFKQLRAPVGIRLNGRQATNHVGDQRTVMDMLDKLSVDHGGNRKGDGTLEVWWPLPTEGRCNPTLWTIILRVQNTFHARGQLVVKPDGVIDPGGRTQQLIMSHGGSHPPPLPASNTKELAKASVPHAMRWVQGAGTYMQMYKAWRSARRAYAFDATAANIHLHLDKLDDAACTSRITEWQENYRLIAAALSNAENVFVRATREEALAARNWMKCWGVTIPAWATPQGNIWFGPDFIGLGPNCKAAILIHEAGHYVRSKIGHQGGERGTVYDTQTPDQALTSAYVCANFATHATVGRDERYGLARPSV